MSWNKYTNSNNWVAKPHRPPVTNLWHSKHPSVRWKFLRRAHKIVTQSWAILLLKLPTKIPPNLSSNLKIEYASNNILGYRVKGLRNDNTIAAIPQIESLRVTTISFGQKTINKSNLILQGKWHLHGSAPRILVVTNEWLTMISYWSMNYWINGKLALKEFTAIYIQLN